jgi:hypothetical protein
MKIVPFAICVCFIFISLSTQAQISWPEELIIPPEKTAFEKTSTYSEVITFLNHLKNRSDNIHLISMGKSLEGKEIPVAVLSSPAVTTPEEAKASGKIVVYVQGNIHGGEVEGKEAIMMLMREILLGDKRNLLENQIILFAPIYNTDGNDKLAKGTRPSQEGSPLEAGIRQNSLGLDLNRDGIKMEAAETQGLFSNIISKWDPQLFVDLHTTNGTWHAYSLTWAPSYHTVGETAPYDYTVRMLKGITKIVQNKYGLALGPYGEYHLEEGWPLKNFYTYNHHPRYLVNQFGLRNRMAILSEAFSHERFYQRIHSTYHFTLEILFYTNKHAQEIRNVNKQAENVAVQNIIEHAGEIKKGVRFKMMSGEKLNDFKTYDYISSEDDKGKFIRTGKIVSYDNVAYHAKFKPTMESAMPRGYVIPAEFTSVVDLLKKHGVKVDQLSKSRSYTGEVFLVDKLENAERVFEGHHMASVSGRFTPAKRKFRKGDYVVDLAQPLCNLIFYLLEPQSDDGLVTWNFFDSYLEKQGVNNKVVQYPVFKFIH